MTIESWLWDYFSSQVFISLAVKVSVNADFWENSIHKKLYQESKKSKAHIKYTNGNAER